MLRLLACLALLLAPLAPAAAQEPYHPPAFNDPGRRARIEALLPEIDALYKAGAAQEHLPGAVWGVVLDGQLIHVGTHGLAHVESARPVTRDTRFRIASMSKSFTALAILKLRDAGRLRLDDPVSKHFPQFRKVKPLTADSPVVTLRHLLRMDGGFPQDDPWGDRKLAESVAELESLVSGGLRFSNPPGTAWEYSNLGYTLLGHVVTRVSGRPYQDYITREILRPLSMSNTVWEIDRVPSGLLAQGYRWEHGRWSPEPMLHDGTFGAMGGLVTTLDDFARYVAMHLDAWPPRNDPERGPVPRATLREMHAPSAMIMAVVDTNVPPGSPVVARAAGYGYGLSWITDSREVTRLRHAGGLPGFGSEYRFLPEHGLALIAFANRTYAPMTAQNGKVLELILQRAQPPKRQIPASDILARRARELAAILQDWPAHGESAALAPNVFLDRALPDWVALTRQHLDPIGPVREIGPVRPLNQLRGRFRIQGRDGARDIFFTLTPEALPRIQDIQFEPAR